MNPNPYLVLSSLSLAVPGFYLQSIPLAACSFIGCGLSMLWHATKPNYPYLLVGDKLFVYTNIGIATMMSLWGLPYSLIPLSLLIAMGCSFYLYGKHYQCFTWHPDCTIATRWHMFFHTFGSIGYLWIIAVKTNCNSSSV
jgi:hypothetical protein